MWINLQNGLVYSGDCAPGDREATAQEVATWRAAQDRAQLDAMSVTAFQAQAAMSLAQSKGITDFDLLAKVQSLVAASSDPMVQIAWGKAQAFERQSPTILGLAAQVPLTSDQLDQLFQLAATITA